MITSDNFDIYPVEKSDVLIHSFDNLVGFSKKNKKRKFVKAIKEEWVYDSDLRKSVYIDRKAEDRELKKKIDSGAVKVVSLDRKKKTTSKSKPTPSANVKKDYTIDEIEIFLWKSSSKIREKFKTEKALTDELIKNKEYREKAKAAMIRHLGAKSQEKETPAPKAKKVDDPTLEKDVFKISEYFFSRKKQFRDLLDGIPDIKVFRRMLSKSPAEAKKFALIMKNNGYKVNLVNEEEENHSEGHFAKVREIIELTEKAIDELNECDCEDCDKIRKVLKRSLTLQKKLIDKPESEKSSEEE